MNMRSSSFADRLRLLREKKRLSKSALARQLGITTTCVWNWEEGNTVPRPENLRALSGALGVPMDYLQDGAGWEGAPSVSHEEGGPEVKSTLPQVIAEAKLRIARLAGIAPENVNISLDY